MKYTVYPKSRTRVMASKVVAADDDLFDDDFADTLDDVADTVEDIQDAVDEVEEDDVDIEVDNNISNHYIAECDGCHGVFISAMIESDQKVDHISGQCPLCGKDTDQYLRWIVKDVDEGEDEIDDQGGAF